MLNKQIHWKIKGKDANAVLKDTDVKMPIHSSNYEEIFIDRDIISVLNNSIDIFYKIFHNDDKKLEHSLMSEIHLSYIPDGENYYIGFDYQDMFSRILSKLAVEPTLIKDLKLPKEIKSMKDYYKCFIEINRIVGMEKILRKTYPVEVPDVIMTDDILNKLIDNLGTVLKGLQDADDVIKKATDMQLEEEKELSEGTKDIAINKHDHISWKNLMFYTSIKALHLFNETKDIKYYRYAKNYYNNATKNRNASFPKGLTVDGKYYHCDFSDFNSEFLSIRKNNFPELLVRLGIEDKDVIVVRKNIKRGKGLKGIIKHGSVTDKKIDYTRINASLGRKITYYQGLVGRTQGIISALDKDYIGYVLDNNYVVFDKFYEVSRDNKAKPASKGALYIVSLDVLDKCNYDRKKLKEYIDKNHDNKAFRYIHNDNDSYKERLDEALNLRDRSRIKYKGLKLKIENKNN